MPYIDFPNLYNLAAWLPTEDNPRKRVPWVFMENLLSGLSDNRIASGELSTESPEGSLVVWVLPNTWLYIGDRGITGAIRSGIQYTEFLFLYPGDENCRIVIDAPLFTAINRVAYTSPESYPRWILTGQDQFGRNVRYSSTYSRPTPLPARERARQEAFGAAYGRIVPPNDESPQSEVQSQPAASEGP